MRPQEISTIARTNVARRKMIDRFGADARAVLAPLSLAKRLRLVNHPYAVWPS